MYYIDLEDRLFIDDGVLVVEKRLINTPQDDEHFDSTVSHTYKRFDGTKKITYETNALNKGCSDLYKCNFIWADSIFWRTFDSVLLDGDIYFGAPLKAVRRENTNILKINHEKGILRLDDFKTIVKADLLKFFNYTFDFQNVHLYFLSRGLFRVGVQTDVGVRTVSILFNGGFD